MFTALLFDLDDTLFDRETCVRALIANQQRHFSAELAGIEPEAYVARVLTLDAHGYAAKDEVYRQIVTEWGLPAGLATTLVGDFWERFHSTGSCFGDVLPALSALRGAGIRMGIITNGSTQTQMRKIERLRLSEFFQAVLVSEREGIRKPERALFERGLQRLGVRADEAWFVGDHPENDIRGAVAAGLTAAWRRTHHWPAPVVQHRAIAGLDELLKWSAAAPAALV